MRIISIEHLDSCKLIRVEHDGVKYINHDFHEHVPYVIVNYKGVHVEFSHWHNEFKDGRWEPTKTHIRPHLDELLSKVLRELKLKKII